MVKSKLNQSRADYQSFIPEFNDRLQAVSDEYLEEYNPHAGFAYLIAELFENTSPDSFFFTDGPKDGGIDFYIKDNQNYNIYQCKCPNPDNYGISISPIPFDNAAIDELLSAINFLLDPSGEYPFKKDILSLRTDYHHDLDSYNDNLSLKANLAIFGVLTADANKYFKAKQKEYLAKQVYLNVINWEDIYQAIHYTEKPSDVDFSIDLNYMTNILRYNNYCFTLAKAHDFYLAFREHGWGLFDWNVRLQLTKSRINKRIINTLLHDKTRKSFHHYNNGILVTCKHYKINESRQLIHLNGPQIINGCQTVRSICVAFESLPPDEQSRFIKDAFVQVKVLKSTDPEFMGELVISTNDQNPMTSRNLKSNTSEQKDLQKGFRNLPMKWFYQRKDGEFDSLIKISTGVKWFKKSEYSAGKQRYRLIDNAKLAKTWHAFIGYSDDALIGGLDYFEDEKFYNLVFNKTPTNDHWTNFINPFFNPEMDNFKKKTPSVYLYLPPFIISEYIRSLKVPPKKNRDEALQRGVEEHELNRDNKTGEILNTDIEIGEYLGKDNEYNLNIILANMQEVLIELYSFIFINAFGKYDEGIAKWILSLREIITYCSGGFSPESAPGTMQDGSALLGVTYQFIKDCMQQYYIQYLAEIKSTPRKKTYLGNRKIINKIRKKILERNEQIKTFDQEWKLLGKTYFNSLPKP